MAKSMTGYGRHQEVINNFDISVELKSVNHKYFDFSLHAPRYYGFLEDKLKSFTQSKVARGKIEMFVNIHNMNQDSITVDINTEYADSYYKALRELKKRYGIKNDISVMKFAENRDIFTVSAGKIDEDTAVESVLSVAEKAIEKFSDMRAIEGRRLSDDIVEKTNEILKQVEFIESKSPLTVKEYRSRLEDKIREVLEDRNIDEQRIITEAAIFADKVAVDEETVRLRSHISQLVSLLKSDIPVGRKLDFIVQEMNREANTIGSKSQSIELTNAVVEIKSIIEKIREQIQNLE